MGSCDPERRSKCEWYLMPNSKNPHTFENGHILLCARNLESKKQDCRLSADISYAKKYYGKAFKYTDLRIKSYKFPREIKNITFCNP